MGLFAVVASISLGQVWALTISPNPPVAGQPFTVTSSNGPGTAIRLYSAYCSPCEPTCVVDQGVSPATFTEAPGQYYIFAADSDGCVALTVVPAPATTTTGVPQIVGVYLGDAFLAHKNYCTASPTHC